MTVTRAMSVPEYRNKLNLLLNPPAVRVYLSSEVQFTGGPGAYTALPWQLKSFESQPMWTHNINPIIASRFRAPVAGVYHFSGRLLFTSGTDISVQVGAADDIDRLPGDQSGKSWPLHGYKVMAEGEYLTVQVKLNNATEVLVAAQSWFALKWCGETPPTLP